MVRSTYFLQECPTCGRGLEIRVEYLGRTMVCQHCGGTFVAAQQVATQQAVTPAVERAEPSLSPAPLVHAQAKAG